MVKMLSPWLTLVASFLETPHLYQWPVGVRILDRSLPIFIQSSSLCCVARQTCRIIGNENNNNSIFEKCGTSADFAGPRDIWWKCGTVPPNAGRLTPMTFMYNAIDYIKSHYLQCKLTANETDLKRFNWTNLKLTNDIQPFASTRVSTVSGQLIWTCRPPFEITPPMSIWTELYGNITSDKDCSPDKP